MSEHNEQAALFEWADRMVGRYPELRLLFAIPNGGFRAKATAAKLHAEGVRPGVPDVCLPVARGGYHACWIEMKCRGGRVRESQADWLTDLSQEGHFAVVCYNWTTAAHIVERYLSGQIIRGCV